MTPEDAMRQRVTFRNGNYFHGPVSALVERVSYVLEQLKVLDAMSSRMAVHRSRQKRIMVGKFERAIRERVAWHSAELRRAADAGFPIAAEYEPRTRTIKVGGGAHHA
jgi:hypothetical protein